MNGWPGILSVDEEADFFATACLVACSVGYIEIVADNISGAREFLRILLDLVWSWNV